jgi:hypothetical protein
MGPFLWSRVRTGVTDGRPCWIIIEVNLAAGACEDITTFSQQLDTVSLAFGLWASSEQNLSNLGVYIWFVLYWLKSLQRSELKRHTAQTFLGAHTIPGTQSLPPLVKKATRSSAFCSIDEAQPRTLTSIPLDLMQSSWLRQWFRQKAPVW